MIIRCDCKDIEHSIYCQCGDVLEQLRNNLHELVEEVIDKETETHKLTPSIISKRLKEGINKWLIKK